MNDRYITTRIDKAEQLEEWIQSLAEEFNKSLGGAELRPEEYTQERASLHIIEPFEVNGQKYFNGFVGIHIKFASKEPKFLTNEDKELWYSRMSELAKGRFSVDPTIARELDYISINFEESSEEELYILTENKEKVIRNGFKRLEEYVKFWCSAVEEYEKNVVSAHNKTLEKYLSNL